MKKIFHHIILCLVLLGVCACSDDLGLQTGGGAAEGKYTFELAMPAPALIVSRAEETEETETVESAAVFVFDKDGNKTKSFVEHSSGNVRYIDIYLTKADWSIYVVCNYSKPQTLLDEVSSLNELQERTLTIESADGAHPGHYVMSGYTINNDKFANNRKIYLQRLAAHVEFTIKVDTRMTDKEGNALNGDEGEFKLTDVYLCNLPQGSYLLDGEDGKEPGEEGSDCDYTQNNRDNYFQKPIRLNVQQEGDEEEGEDIITTGSFDMFENRRGAVADIPANWPVLTGLENRDDYTYLKQLFKRERAMDYPEHIGGIKMKDDESDEEYSNEELEKNTDVKDSRFYNATYLRIDGVYKRKDKYGLKGKTFRTSYYVYLGADNYKDFNVRRNHRYRHDITIRSCDFFDSRVIGTNLSDAEVYAPFDEELDAHCNVVKALIYAPADWTVEVKDPDQTPWLEVSRSAVYKPRLQGQPAHKNDAAFSISDTEGLRYFYIHTDEFIPEINNPGENVTYLQHFGIKRTGTIVVRCNGKEKEYTVTQLPAEIAILHIKYDVHTMTEVRDTFYIERKLEQKYIPWGFYHYWSYVTDDLIASGTWDGLSNTRKLYEVGLKGEFNKKGEQIFPPAYPDADGVLPYDHAIGYVVAKNRDRNGDGKIGYDEITWYWPATKEMEKIFELKDEALLHFEGSTEPFFASTPSSSDKAGITPGFGVRVKLEDGHKIEWMPVQRDRRYNVLACRRKNAWKGPNTGTAEGDVTTKPGWDKGEDDEVIMPK